MTSAQVLSIHQRPNLRLQGHNVEVVAHAVQAAVLVLVPWCHAAASGQKKGLCLGEIAGFIIYVVFLGKMMVFRDVNTRN